MAPMSDLLPLLDMVLEKAPFRIKLKNNFKRNLDYIVKDEKKKESVCVVPTPHFPMQCLACEEHWALTRH